MPTLLRRDFDDVPWDAGRADGGDDDGGVAPCWVQDMLCSVRNCRRLSLECTVFVMRSASVSCIIEP